MEEHNSKLALNKGSPIDDSQGESDGDISPSHCTHPSWLYNQLVIIWHICRRKKQNGLKYIWKIYMVVNSKEMGVVGE